MWKVISGNFRPENQLFFPVNKIKITTTTKLHISSSYAKILGETHFQPWEIPRSGSKAKDGKEREKERPKVGNNNGQLRIATPPRVAHAKPPGPISCPGRQSKEAAKLFVTSANKCQNPRDIYLMVKTCIILDHLLYKESYQFKNMGF